MSHYPRNRISDQKSPKRGGVSCPKTATPKRPKRSSTIS
uniref:Uncharacterized protein n=1 Tax=Podoviridae sp. cttxo15 TaxID=2826584 RepID=A0A8S5N223_9CAUD|nr:MAG TPA: hypothetical protein [Podoviridae sp. cttxo15]